MSKFANKFTSYSIDSSLIIDMTAKHDDRQFWDLGTREDQERLKQLQQEHQTELLIGSAPCTSFRTVLHRSEKGTKEQIENAQDEERQYTQACIKAYKRQLSMGTFLARTPSASAMGGYIWCKVRSVTGTWLRQAIEMNRDSCVEKRDGQRAAEGMLEKIVECGLIGQNETDVLTETCERSVKSAREAAG